MLLINSPYSHALAFPSYLVGSRKDSDFNSKSGPCLSLVGEDASLISIASCNIQLPLPTKWILPMKSVGAA